MIGCPGRSLVVAVNGAGRRWIPPVIPAAGDLIQPVNPSGWVDDGDGPRVALYYHRGAGALCRGPYPLRCSGDCPADNSESGGRQSIPVGWRVDTSQGKELEVGSLVLRFCGKYY